MPIDPQNDKNIYLRKIAFTRNLFVKEGVDKEILNAFYDVKSDYMAAIKYILKTLVTKVE